MLRTYIALIATSGIRPGLEAKRIKIGNVLFRVQEGRPVIIVRIVRHQGKHPKARGVVVYEGDCFDVRSLLVDHIAWRQQQGAKDTYDLFAWPDGTHPHFRDILRSVLTAANALTDPMTGEERVGTASDTISPPSWSNLGCRWRRSLSGSVVPAG